MAYFILNNFNKTLLSAGYHASLKFADITLIFKNDNKTDKVNYRPPINILLELGKI